MAKWLTCQIEIGGDPPGFLPSSLWFNSLAVLEIANWSASCQLGFSTCSFHLLHSVAICIEGPHQCKTGNY